MEAVILILISIWLFFWASGYIACITMIFTHKDLSGLALILFTLGTLTAFSIIPTSFFLYSGLYL